MRLNISCLVLAMLSLLQCLAVSAEEKKKIAVTNIEVAVSLSKIAAKTLNEIQLSEFSRSTRLSVMGSSDITDMLKFKERKLSLVNCTDDSCLAEIGGALGVQYLASTNVARIGGILAVTVKVLDVQNVKVVARVSETLHGGEPELIPTLKLAIAKTIEQCTGEVGLVATTITERKQSTMFMDVAPWVTLGIGVLAGTASAITGGMALGDAETARGEFTGSGPWQTAHDSMETNALTSDILLAVACTAIVGTAIMWLLDD